ncbi:MAG: flagellar basal body-associated FliL family protein [bacterium]
MARSPGEEEEEEEGQETEEEPNKGGSVKWIIIAIVVLAVLGAGSFAVWNFVLSSDDPAATSEAKEKGREKEAAGVGPIVPLKVFIVNLADPGGRRYLKVRIELELSSEEAQEEMKGHIPEIRDSIILALSSKTYQQIQSVAGKTVLREELTARMNSLMRTGRVKKIFFTEFVVQ